MIELGPKFSNTWRGYPTRFSPTDHELWKKWIPKHYQEYNGFYFDVRIMNPAELPPNLEPEMARMWLVNRARKIDMIAVKGDQALIVEFRDRAGLSVIGQIMGYKALIMLENPWPLEPQILVVSDTIEQNVQDALFMLKVPFELIPPA